ncbi:hypothetical protein JHK84_027334 [Glycine max]|nr:hypothetical protein JHK84_027334 [Glycine max]
MRGFKLTERFKSTEVHALSSSSSETNHGNSSKASVAATTKPHNYLNRNKIMLPSWSKTKSRTTNNNSTSLVANLAPSDVCVVETFDELEEEMPQGQKLQGVLTAQEVHEVLTHRRAVVGHDNSEKGNTVACGGATRRDAETKDARQCMLPSFSRGHGGAMEMQANGKGHGEVTVEISDKRGGSSSEVGVFIT